MSDYILTKSKSELHISKVVNIGLERLKRNYSKKFTNFIYYNNK